MPRRRRQSPQLISPVPAQPHRPVQCRCRPRRYPASRTDLAVVCTPAHGHDRHCRAYCRIAVDAVGHHHDGRRSRHEFLDAAPSKPPSRDRFDDCRLDPPTSEAPMHSTAGATDSDRRYPASNPTYQTGAKPHVMQADTHTDAGRAAGSGRGFDETSGRASHRIRRIPCVRSTGAENVLCARSLLRSMPPRTLWRGTAEVVEVGAGRHQSAIPELDCQAAQFFQIDVRGRIQAT